MQRVPCAHVCANDLHSALYATPLNQYILHGNDIGGLAFLPSSRKMRQPAPPPLHPVLLSPLSPPPTHLCPKFTTRWSMSGLMPSLLM